MIFIYFIYGLSFFSLGFITLGEARHPRKLPLSRQLPWLSWFAITHSLVEWSDMFLLIGVQQQVSLYLSIFRSILLPLSALLLVRFGLALLPKLETTAPKIGFWLLILSVLASLFIRYTFVHVDYFSEWRLAIDVGSRYLIYFPANLFAAFGLIRQRSDLRHAGYGDVNLLLWVASSFFLNAFMAGLAVPPLNSGLASWLNDKSILQVTGLPVQAWRAFSALTITFFMVRILDIFEAARKKELAELEQARSSAQQAMLDAEVNARIDARNWNNALVGISRCIAEMDSPEDLLIKIVDIARSLLMADMAYLALWNQDGQHLGLKYYANESEQRLCKSDVITEPALLDVVAACRSACYPQDFGSQPTPLYCGVTNRVITNAVIVTLKLDNQPFGAIWICREQGPFFSQQDVAGLEHLADQAVIAIVHSSMAAKLQSLAVMDERSRIAREMHDGLAQILGYLRLETQTLEALVKQGDKDVVIAKLQQARRNIDLAHADVRENILSLRTTLSNEAGTIPALQEYLTEFSIQTGIKVIFDNEVQSDIHVSPMTETQMVCIIQEALTNVRKHSRAKEALLHIDSTGDCLRVSVTDDGVGFAHSHASRSFGLQTMRERAEGVGGGLTITSRPGKGTQINLWLPLLRNQSRK